MTGRQGRFVGLKTLDWEAIAGIVAAVVALVLHLLGFADEGVIITVVLVVLALLLLRDLRREDRDERVEAASSEMHRLLLRMESSLTGPDAVLVGPRQLRQASEAFAHGARGEMTYFNVCLLMFRPQSLFDALLKPALDNRDVTAIQFVLDHGEKGRWDEDVLPKVRQCAGAAKVREPRWVDLHESVSFILADDAAGRTEAHLSFWGEPFMAKSTGRQLPRYIFHVQPHSELIPRLIELERDYRSRH